MNSYPMGATMPSQWSNTSQSTLPSFEAILKGYKQYIFKMARHYGRFYDEHFRNDLIQEANIALWKAYRAFNSSHGTAFEHYAKKAISNSLSKAVVALQNDYLEFQQFSTQDGSLDNNDWVNEVPEENYSATFTNTELSTGIKQVQKHIKSLSDALPEPKRIIFEKVFHEGMTAVELAKELGVSHQTIYKQYQLIEKLIHNTVNHMRH